MNIDIKSSNECRMLLDRIEKTLTAIGFGMNRIRRGPASFCADDTCIFRGLSEAILSNRAVWSSVRPHLDTIAQALCVYNISKVASLSDSDLATLYTNRLKPLKIRSGRLRRGLREIRDNAEAFQDFIEKHGAIRNFILTYLDDGRMEQLRDQFTGKCPGFKLHGVGVAICSEFFNNIGIDEFKGDSNTTRFFGRIGIAKAKASPEDIRTIGITIAKNSGKPRGFVDSLIWCFCAEDESEICTTYNPKCHLCKLSTEEPRFCTYSGSFTTPSIASSKYEGTNPAQLVRLLGETTLGGPSKGDSNLLEKEAEMNLPPGMGIVVNARINDPRRSPQDVYKDGLAKGLLRFEIGIAPSELGKMKSAFPNSYIFTRSTAKTKDCEWHVDIALVIGQSQYNGKLCVSPIHPDNSGAWISASLGGNNKLAYALKSGGFVSEGPVKLAVLANKIWVLKP